MPSSLSVLFCCNPCATRSSSLHCCLMWGWQAKLKKPLEQVWYRASVRIAAPEAFRPLRRHGWALLVPGRGNTFVLFLSPSTFDGFPLAGRFLERAMEEAFGKVEACPAVPWSSCGGLHPAILYLGKWSKACAPLGSPNVLTVIYTRSRM